AGILAVTRSGSDPRPAIPGVPIADLAGAFNAALAILAALRTRDRTGRGEFIDLSIYDTTIALMVLGLARYFATGEEPIAGETLLTGTSPSYALYETKDDIPGLGQRRVIAHPAKHAVTTIANPARVPKKGEHTEEILRSLGFSARQISGLSKKGIVAT